MNVRIASIKSHIQQNDMHNRHRDGLTKRHYGYSNYGSYNKYQVSTCSMWKYCTTYALYHVLKNIISPIALKNLIVIAVLCMPVLPPIANAQLATTNHAQVIPALMSPQQLSAGDVFVLIDHGYPAIFSNPAVLTRMPATVSYFNQTSWLYNDISHLIPSIADFLSRNLANSTSQNGLQPLLQENVFGFGGSIATGYYGNNFAAALSLGTDLALYGNDFPNNLRTIMNNDVRLSISLAYPVELDSIEFSAGFTIEPFYHTHSYFDGAQTAYLLNRHFGVGVDNATHYLTAENTLYGTGIAIHLGFLLTIEEVVTIGFSLRDLGDTILNYSIIELGSYLEYVSSINLPSNVARGEEGFVQSSSYVIPTNFRFGIAYHPTPPAILPFEPRVAIEIDESIVTLNATTQYSLFDSLHIGAIVRFENQFELRIGLNQGQFTLGTGFDFGVFELETAWFGLARAFPDKSVDATGLIFSIHFDEDVNRQTIDTIRNQ